jgi:hypothetical protein
VFFLAHLRDALTITPTRRTNEDGWLFGEVIECFVFGQTMPKNMDREADAGQE